MTVDPLLQLSLVARGVSLSKVQGSGHVSKSYGVLRNHQTESPAAAWTGLSWTWPSQLPVMRLWWRAHARSETHLGHPSDSPSDPGDRGGVAVWGRWDGCPTVVTLVCWPRGLHEGNQQKQPRIKRYSCFFATVKSETPAAALGGLRGRGPPNVYIYTLYSCQSKYVTKSKVT